jgi:hypothetical protein
MKIYPTEAMESPVDALKYLEDEVSPVLEAANMNLVIANGAQPATITVRIIHDRQRQLVYVDPAISAFLHRDLQVGLGNYGFNWDGQMWSLPEYPPSGASLDLVRALGDVVPLVVNFATI